MGRIRTKPRQYTLIIIFQVKLLMCRQSSNLFTHCKCTTTIGLYSSTIHLWHGQAISMPISSSFPLNDTTLPICKRTPLGSWVLKIINSSGQEKQYVKFQHK